MPYARRPLLASFVQRFQARRGRGSTNQRELALVWELNETAHEGVPGITREAFKAP
jgi:hypothetical protein